MPKGSWEPIIDPWPHSQHDRHRAIHLVLVWHANTWKVLAFGDGEGPRDARKTVCHLYHADDLDANTHPVEVITSEYTDIFCAGHCHMEDGNVLFAGGGFIPGHSKPPLDVNVLDLSQTPPVFRRLRSINRSRWYPTCTMLMEGQVLITSGLRGTLDRRWPPDATAPWVIPCHSHRRTVGVAA